MSITLTPKAAACLRVISECDCGYPDKALHPAHRRFFLRYRLIEQHSDGRVRTTDFGNTITAKGA